MWILFSDFIIKYMESNTMRFKKRKSYDALKKLEVLQYRNNHTLRETSGQFDVPESNIRAWEKRKLDFMFENSLILFRLYFYYFSDVPGTKRTKRFRSAYWPDLENILFEWILELRSKKVSNDLSLRHQ